MSRHKKSPSLEVLVFKMGGVAGAVRRIVRRSRQPVSAHFVRYKIQRQYPALIPSEHQVEDTLTDMLKRGRVAKQFDRFHGTRYQPSKPIRFIKPKRPRQLKFEFLTSSKL